MIDLDIKLMEWIGWLVNGVGINVYLLKEKKI